MSSHETYTTNRGIGTTSRPAAGVPYFTPAQVPPAGTALSDSTQSGSSLPTLFTPLKLRGVTLQNRFVVSPMCMYSADDGHMSDFHLVHLGQFALHGAALTIVEATSVTPNGRITPEDCGLWQDSQIAPLRRVADYIHSQGQHIGIQLGHAGRKASTVAPWLECARGLHRCIGAEGGGWMDNVWAPSAVAFSPGWSSPNAMSHDDIRALIDAFVAAAKRAIVAGIDVIEIHGAHGYLLGEFMSPLSNQRTDNYGGSFENRVRLALEVIRAVRAVIPDTMPLFLRVSGTEWMEGQVEHSWTIDDTIRLAKLLPALGVDLLDVSSGGNHPAQKIDVTNQYLHAELAVAVRKALDADGVSRDAFRIGCVGYIVSTARAKETVQAADKADGDGRLIEADVAIVGRQFLREPEFVFRTAHELGVTVRWPNQYHRAQGFN